MNLDKKNSELLCLDRVIKAKKSLHIESQQIIDKISGNEFDRIDTERPDLVRYCPPTSKNEKGTLIGIEHFRVDRLSLQKKDGRVASTGIATEKAVYEIYEQWHEEVTTSEEIPEGAVSDIANLVAAQIHKEEKSSYNTFFKSFEYSLNKHLESIDVYRTNLQKLSEEKYNTELALLIEIHSEFRNLFLNNKRGTYREKNNFTPIFEDMVRLMEEKVDCNKVDYIILCMGGTIYTDKIKVIAIRTEDIRKQLEKQNIAVYEYAGEDLIFTDFEVTQRKVRNEPRYKIDGDKISFVIEHTDEELNEQFMLGAMFYSLRKALEYRKQGKNFVTTYGTQMMLDVLGDYIIRWERKDDEQIDSPVFRSLIREDIAYRMMEFEQRFSMQRKEEDYE